MLFKAHAYYQCDFCACCFVESFSEKRQAAAGCFPESMTVLVAVMVPRGQDPDAVPLCPQCQLRDCHGMLPEQGFFSWAKLTKEMWDSQSQWQIACLQVEGLASLGGPCPTVTHTGALGVEVIPSPFCFNASGLVRRASLIDAQELFIIFLSFALLSFDPGRSNTKLRVSGYNLLTTLLFHGSHFHTYFLCMASDTDFLF